MSDLAERLKNLKARIELAHAEQDSRSVVCGLNEFNDTTWKNADTIISVLQFAENMQRLMNRGLAPELYWQDGQAVCHMAEKFYGKDKFEAARAAVEKMEGK